MCYDKWIMTISQADLPLNADGSVYHLHLLPDEIADTIIFVGDPNRAKIISHYFNTIEVHKSHRELVTYTGYIGSKRLSVIGTGMSSGNIDIVINELDALVNVDLKKREIKPKHTTLNIIRLGTGGGLQAQLGVNKLVISNYAVGFDGLMNFYHCPTETDEDQIKQHAQQHFKQFKIANSIYANSATPKLLQHFATLGVVGITLSTAGFFGPQARLVRAPLVHPDFLTAATQFEFNTIKAANFEMETAAIYGLCHLLGHNCCSINAIIANRITNQFNQNYNKFVIDMIEAAVEKMLTL